MTESPKGVHAARGSASYHTGVEGSVTLLAKSRQSISNAMGAPFTKGLVSVSPVFKRRMQDCFSAGPDLTNRIWGGEVGAHLAPCVVEANGQE